MDQSGDFIKRLECLMDRAERGKQWGMVVYYQEMISEKKSLEMTQEIKTSES
jgi:hypothetical protein